MTIGYTAATDIAELLDPDQGLVSRQVFTDPGVYQLELARIFARCWQFIGHESQIPFSGDFVSAYLGEDPVLVVRQDDGGIAGFLNVCRHRGMKICKLDAGNAPGFSCSYHGWAYDRRGKIVDFPFQEMYEHAPLDEGWAAVPIAQVQSYKGLIFGTFDPDAPSLVDYLGDFAYYLDVLVDRREGGTELIGGPNRCIIEANWKYGAENFVQDGHHSFASHVSALMAVQDDDQDTLDFPTGCSVRPGGGHGGVWFAENTLALVARDPLLLEYHRDVVRPESVRRLGRERDPIHNIGAFTVFPNFSYLTGVQTIRLWIPRGPNHMEVRAWTIVDRDAPQAVKDAQLKFVRTTFSPSGILEQDDGENWSMCQDTLRGHVSRQLDSNVRMGLGQPFDPDTTRPGRVMPGWNEEPGRGFFKRYGQLMTDPTSRVWEKEEPS
jgi:phenylpropionate dioxygenase-like ring-hydroxylating dioxygenase large terminal subunit